MTPLQITLILLQTLPSLILDVEALFSGKSKAGAEKKSYVLDVVERGAELAGKFGVQALEDKAARDQIVAIAGSITDALVFGFNKSDTMPTSSASA